MNCLSNIIVKKSQSLKPITAKIYDSPTIPIKVETFDPYYMYKGKSRTPVGFRVLNKINKKLIEPVDSTVPPPSPIVCHDTYTLLNVKLVSCNHTPVYLNKINDIDEFKFGFAVQGNGILIKYQDDSYYIITLNNQLYAMKDIDLVNLTLMPNNCQTPGGPGPLILPGLTIGILSSFNQSAINQFENGELPTGVDKIYYIPKSNTVIALQIRQDRIGNTNYLIQTEDIQNLLVNNCDKICYRFVLTRKRPLRAGPLT